jgi:hypothetical protein
LEFCNKHNTSTLQEIHASFNNVDRIGALIQKQRLLSYPAGQGYNGLLFELQQNPKIKVSEVLTKYFISS